MANRITFKFLVYFVQKFPFSHTFDKFNLHFYLPSSSLLFWPLSCNLCRFDKRICFRILREAVGLSTPLPPSPLNFQASQEVHYKNTTHSFHNIGDSTANGFFIKSVIDHSANKSFLLPLFQFRLQNSHYSHKYPFSTYFSLYFLFLFIKNLNKILFKTVAYMCMSNATYCLEKV